eukprot:COSAG01_NODE_33684_length_560_cov_1.334056_1_plen_35_part_10
MADPAPAPASAGVATVSDEWAGRSLEALEAGDVGV